MRSGWSEELALRIIAVRLLAPTTGCALTVVPPTTWALESLAVTREIMLRTASAKVNDAGAEILKEKLKVPSNLINLAGRQRMPLQKMAMEAGL